jgi:hypothetical protein
MSASPAQSVDDAALVSNDLHGDIAAPDMSNTVPTAMPVPRRWTITLDTLDSPYPAGLDSLCTADILGHFWGHNLLKYRIPPNKIGHVIPVGGPKTFQSSPKIETS